ncbi:hypothetical protein D3C86_1953780 [compost metagenome]
MYRQPSGPNSIFTGLNQSSSEVSKSGKCVAETVPSAFLTTFTELTELVIGLARNATSRNASGNEPDASSANAVPEMPVPPTRNECNAGING